MTVGELYEFEPIEPGRYTLTIWSEFADGPVRDIYVDGYTRKTEPVWIDPDLVRARMAATDTVLRASACFVARSAAIRWSGRAPRDVA